MKVAILLATYNGEKYLRPQLESILSQTFTAWDLYIQDDLSSDKTIDIINEYVQVDERIHFVSNSQKLGALRNFSTLMEKVEADYYFFSDQDDVWLPFKMERTLKRLLACEDKDIPIIVHSDLRVVDEDLQIIDNSLWGMFRINPALLHTFDSLVSHCLLTGCTMAFNQKAKEVSLPIPSEAIMHDVWMGLCVLKNEGTIQDIQEPTILYRQHGRNTLGAHDDRNNYLINRLKNLQSTFQKQKQFLRMLSKIEKVSFARFYFEKLKYNIAYYLARYSPKKDEIIVEPK